MHADAAPDRYSGSLLLLRGPEQLPESAGLHETTSDRMQTRSKPRSAVILILLT